MGFLPWLQAVENQEGVFPGEWGWDFVKSIGEIRFRSVRVIELVGNAFEISDLRIVRVRRAFVCLVGKHRVLVGLNQVDLGSDKTGDWSVDVLDKVVLARGRSWSDKEGFLVAGSSTANRQLSMDVFGGGFIGTYVLFTVKP